jgi:hypothetical protein
LWKISTAEKKKPNVTTGLRDSVITAAVFQQKKQYQIKTKSDWSDHFGTSQKAKSKRQKQTGNASDT